jgi:hypothetical protein
MLGAWSDTSVVITVIVLNDSLAIFPSLATIMTTGIGIQFSSELATHMKVMVIESLFKEQVNLHILLEKHQAAETKHCEPAKTADDTR